SEEFAPKYETLENIAELISDAAGNDAESKHDGAANHPPELGHGGSLSGDIPALGDTRFYEAMPEEKPTRTERLSHRTPRRRQNRALAAEEKHSSGSHRSGARSERSQPGSRIPLRTARRSRAT